MAMAMPDDEGVLTVPKTASFASSLMEVGVYRKTPMHNDGVVWTDGDLNRTVY